jgi:LysM domain
MFVNQIVNYGRAIRWMTVPTAALLLGACSLFRPHHQEEAPLPPPVETTDSATMAPEGPQTVTEAVADKPADETLAPNPDSTTIMADAGGALSSTAPKSYVVQRGDTLWGIASTFLKDPLSWPEIWYVNPSIPNPHRIFPGDTIRLAQGSDGRTQLVVTPGDAARAWRLGPLLRSTPIDGPIATIPYEAISAFLSRPGVLTKEQVKAAPYILSLPDGHVIAGDTDLVYVKNAGDASVAQRFSVLHVEQMLKDPGNGTLLGYLCNYTATAQITRTGATDSAVLSETERETLRGDVLVASNTANRADFVPHAPRQAVHGEIVAIPNGVLRAGQYDVVALDRGSIDGLEPGHVVRVYQAAAEETDDHCAKIEGNGTCVKFHAEKLPIEQAGTLLVFRTYEHLSFALLLNETNPVHTGDIFRGP